MATTILFKRNSNLGVAPDPASLQSGEIALNTAETRIFTKKSDNTIDVLNNRTFQRTFDPGAGNDITQGYRVNDTIINTETGVSFVCQNSTTGAAVWTPYGREVNSTDMLYPYYLYGTL